jgi:hypothetical protein
MECPYYTRGERLGDICGVAFECVCCGNDVEHCSLTNSSIPGYQVYQANIRNNTAEIVNSRHGLEPGKIESARARLLEIFSQTESRRASTPQRTG